MNYLTLNSFNMKQCSFFPTMLAAAFLLSACKKELDPATVNVNELTFGCKVNGKSFIADYWDYGYNIPPIHIDFCWDPVNRKSYLIVRGEKENESVFLYLNSPIMKGKKYLNTQTISWPCNVHPQDYGSYTTRYPGREYITNTIDTGYVDIIFVDTTKNKIEANFEFKGFDQGSGQTVQVTNGYFKNF